MGCAPWVHAMVVATLEAEVCPNSGHSDWLEPTLLKMGTGRGHLSKNKLVFFSKTRL